MNKIKLGENSNEEIIIKDRDGEENLERKLFQNKKANKIFICVGIFVVVLIIAVIVISNVL